MVLGTVSYSPPTDSNVPFSYDILTPLVALIEGGATNIGLRARSTVNDAPNALSMVELEIATLCGNGMMEGDEECDAGTDNSDTEPDACRRACVDAFCGDGVVDTGEDCDEGDANGPDGACPLTCGLEPDAGMPDAGSDAGSDAGADAGSDAGEPDASAADVGVALDSAVPDASTGEDGGGGCGCRTTNTGDAWFALILVGVLLRRRS